MQLHTYSSDILLEHLQASFLPSSGLLFLSDGRSNATPMSQALSSNLAMNQDVLSSSPYYILMRIPRKFWFPLLWILQIIIHAVDQWGWLSCLKTNLCSLMKPYQRHKDLKLPALQTGTDAVIWFFLGSWNLYVLLLLNQSCGLIFPKMFGASWESDLRLLQNRWSPRADLWSSARVTGCH